MLCLVEGRERRLGVQVGGLKGGRDGGREGVVVERFLLDVLVLVEVEHVGRW